VWRRLMPATAVYLQRVFGPIDAAGRRGAVTQARRLETFLEKHHGPGGTLGRTWPTGSMALWVAVLLAVFTLAYYL